MYHQARWPQWHPAQLPQACPVTTVTADRCSVVRLPADIRARARVDAGSLVLTAWAPGITLLVADTALVEWWDARGLDGLLRTNRALASRGSALRLVVWSRDLYDAVQLSAVSCKPSVYTSIDAALRSDQR